jgi:hypothetical protein
VKHLIELLNGDIIPRKMAIRPKSKKIKNRVSELSMKYDDS